VQEKILEILNFNVAPSLGNAESAAVALACARGATECGGRIDRLKVTVDICTMKKAYADKIPGLNGGGMVLAAAIGALRGRYKKKLMTFESLNKNDLAAAEKFIAEDRVEIKIDETKRGLFIEAEVHGQEHVVLVRLEGSQGNISLVEIDGRPSPREDKQVESDRFFSTRSFLRFLSCFSLAELVGLVEQIDINKLAFLRDGIDMVDRAAEAGLAKRPGIGYGAALRDLISRQDISHNVLSYARIKAGAAGDARMGGLPLPVMASFGSGNYGIVIYATLSVVANKEGASAERLTRAIAISHLLVGVTKFYTGLLTPHCGCTVGAGASATVGAVYLMGGSVQEMDNAFRSFISNLGGIICGGANEYCAQKMGTAAVSAVENAYLAVKSRFTPKELGIVGKDYRETLENLKTLTRDGMKDIDGILVDILSRRTSSANRVGLAADAAE